MNCLERMPLQQKRMLAAITLLISSLLVLPAKAQEPPTLFEEPLSPRIANYNIDVQLNTDTKVLTAQELLVWHNQTQSVVYELQFHLYMNGFRNTESTFMQGTGNPRRSQRIKDKGWGFIEIYRLVVGYPSDIPNLPQTLFPDSALNAMQPAADLTAGMTFIQPDDGNKEDKSILRVPLPKPLRPGEKVMVYLDFRTKLPEPSFMRTGAKKEYFMVAQWFPKMGVHINGEWNTHQFHSRTNFFSDFGVYNVRMTVPEENLVGATGLQVSVSKNGDGTATHFYHAEDVLDFAWTTSPDFVEVTGKSQDVDIRMLMQPDHLDSQDRMLESTKLAVQYFQDWYGDYPYPNVTVVDQRRGAESTGGMEYPTLFTTSTSYGLPKGVRIPEMINTHEFGHSYWYHMLASNEFEEAWLDEGINTYTDMQIMPAAYGKEANTIDVAGIKIGQTTMARAQYLSLPDADPLIKSSWKFYSGRSYGINSDARPGLVLTTLQNYLGWDTMLKVIRTYVERWRFKHPRSRDFFDIINEVAGQNLDWFFEQAFYTNAILDYTVSDIFSRPVKKPKGYDYTLSTTQEDSVVTNDENTVEEAADTDTASAEGEEKLYFSGVNIRRLGEFEFPVEVELIFDDGEIVRENWDGQALWTKFRYTKPVRLVSATVDPDYKIPLDANLTNNSRVVKKQTLGINKLAVRWMFWQQFVLDQPDFANLLFRIGEVLN